MTAPTAHTPEHIPEYTPEELAVFEQQWIDTVQEDQELTRFGLYPQGSRDRGKGELQGSYQIYLPPAYEDDPDARFPVVYWLHGGFGNARQGGAAVQRIDAAIRVGAMPPTIVVLPQALPIGWYVDSKDGARPVEQTIADDLVNHVDATYRTIREPWARTIEGFSMGGFGALHIGFKYPKIFGRVSAIASPLLKDLSMEPDERVANTFFGDQAYYDAVSPWTLLLANSPEIRNHSKVRLMVGSRDERLVGVVREMDEMLATLGVEHEYHVVAGADHDYPVLLDGLGDRYAAFWRK
ncbi:alpha/beta hydrolase [Streptomyces sp. NBC_00035]|uniref:alpha/beta hydrolase n=1 Tax=Streptomyces sp. NBC_00035 TaxID=2903614 RepID=UPI00325519A4